MNLEFLEELNEARLFRGADTLKGKSAKDLAKIAYLMILMLEVLRRRDESWAKKYASDTMGYDNFNTMRNYATDLHNLLAVLGHQDKYEGKISVDSKISVPTLQLKRYLRDIQDGRTDRSQDRSLFKKLEDYFKISDSNLKQYRRVVGDWGLSSSDERNSILHRMRATMQSYGQYSDISRHFTDKVPR